MINNPLRLLSESNQRILSFQRCNDGIVMAIHLRNNTTFHVHLTDEVVNAMEPYSKFFNGLMKEEGFILMFLPSEIKLLKKCYRTDPNGKPDHNVILSKIKGIYQSSGIKTVEHKGSYEPMRIIPMIPIDLER